VRAWQQFGGIVDESYGGHPRALTINFLEAGNPLFATPPGCYLLDQSPGFWRTFQQDNPTAQPVSDFDFFAFPDINLAYAGAEQVTGDLVSVFKDSPAARSLIAYLATPQAQAGWAQRGDTLSANRSVPLTEYPDPLSEQAARILTQAPVVVFDAGAILPPDVDAAFLRGVLDYVKDPASLPAILAHLNQVQTGKASPSSGP
jgi:alpha-glucoside transport system substrate-binding protein